VIDKPAKIANRIIIKLQIFLLVFGLFLSTNSHAAEILGVHFQDNYKEEGIHLSLQGIGVKTSFFIKVFVAGFYKDDRIATNILGQYVKKIEVEYFVNISAEKMNDFTIKSMRRNISSSEFEQITEQIALMNQYFVDLKPGDRYALTFIPNVGTRFIYNGQLLGTIKGATFAKALFSTWLGEKPFDRKLKNKILGKDSSQHFAKQKIVLSTVLPKDIP
jgi:hypothetical protein